MSVKLAVKLLIILAVCVILILITDSLLQPKVRVVPLEGVPESSGAPDVTFMLGANMDPLVQTNPFLVIFSPIERLTDQTRVVSGTLHANSDSTAVFVWEAFRLRSNWHIDRVTHRLTAVNPAADSGPPHLCTRLFPTLAAVFRAPHPSK